MRLNVIFAAIVCVFWVATSRAQAPNLDYYLPGINYDTEIPTPESILGFQVGEWHISHDQLVRYMTELATSSDRMQLEQIGRTHEKRPLLILTVSHPDNLARLEEIKTRHRQNTDPAAEAPDMQAEPVVVYQGFSIHGNEPSGSNAAVLLAYHLAAAPESEVGPLLRETVILLDPCFNPDGFHRFSTWVNMHRSAVGNADPQSREFNEVWPGGRTNHYWFDLNRDWLLASHPESQSRLAVFQDWRPNVLTDHHEMGTNSTFFFQPGVPQRTNPLTPDRNQALTARIGEFHAEALDKIGSLYYSEENYDDYYYGKGSTYPDINGSIGILFEQASARGHVQESRNGRLTFAFAIRNQLTTALSTLRASRALRADLLAYQRSFFADAAAEAKADPRKAFVFAAPRDPARSQAFLELLDRHDIRILQTSETIEVDGQTFDPATSYVVPLAQRQYRLIRTIFEPINEFRDSIFYDVSAWTLPMAFNLQYAALTDAGTYRQITDASQTAVNPVPAAAPSFSNYAYLLPWEHHQAPEAVYYLLRNGLRLKVAMQPFVSDGQAYERGTILIPVSTQNRPAEQVHDLIKGASGLAGIEIQPLESGLNPLGIDLGSNEFASLQQPSILVVSGEGAYAYEVGEMWHLLEKRYGIPVSMIDGSDLHRANLDRYNVILMAHGSYNTIRNRAVDKLKTWIRQGGTFICQRGAVNWAISKQISQAQIQENGEEETAKDAWPPYARLNADYGSGVIGGAILETKTDATHPLLFGIPEGNLPVFRRGTLFLKPTDNPFASPVRYTETPVLSGYVRADHTEQIAGSPALVVNGLGRGRVISICDNYQFRAYWYGTEKLTANAIFFGRLISRRALEE